MAGYANVLSTTKNNIRVGTILKKTFDTTYYIILYIRSCPAHSPHSLVSINFPNSRLKMHKIGQPGFAGNYFYARVCVSRTAANARSADTVCTNMAYKSPCMSAEDSILACILFSTRKRRQIFNAFFFLAKYRITQRKHDEFVFTIYQTHANYFHIISYDGVRTYLIGNCVNKKYTTKTLLCINCVFFTQSIIAPCWCVLRRYRIWTEGPDIDGRSVFRSHFWLYVFCQYLDML